MNAPESWSERIELYLSDRRNAGFNVSGDITRLRQFACFADLRKAAQPHLTVMLAVEWARSSKHQRPITWARRLEVLRCFAKYWQRFDPLTEVPPSGLLGRAYRRLVPHVFTEQEVSALMAATDQYISRDSLRSATCKTMFGLLGSCGLRPAEAIRLTRADVDLDNGVLFIGEAKGHRSRWVPLHQSVTNALCTYAQLRNRVVAEPPNDRFFLLDNGHPASVGTIQRALEMLCGKLGWLPRGDYAHHRCYDFRHSFIVNTLLHLHQIGIDADHAILPLSTYVGHTSIAHTYWYCTATPELMAIVGECFHRYALGDPS